MHKFWFLVRSIVAIIFANFSTKRVNVMIDDVYSYDGLHLQEKKGYHWSVIQSELQLISDRGPSAVSVFVFSFRKVWPLLIVCLFGFVNDAYRRLNIINAILSHIKGDIFSVFSVATYLFSYSLSIIHRYIKQRQRTE